MKTHQISCLEGKKIDLRQAEAVLLHRPDVVIFEAPPVGKTPSLIYNKYSASKKPLREVEKYKRMLRRLATKAPWVMSDIYVYENIVKLWKEGHDVKLYNVDAPTKLLRINLKIDKNWDPKPYRRGTHFEWWVRIYLREKIMTENILEILSKNNKKDFKVLIFLQKFHWLNVQFLMSKPSKKQTYEYYFGKFKRTNMGAIGCDVRNVNEALYKYWKNISDFK